MGIFSSRCVQNISGGFEFRELLILLKHNCFFYLLWQFTRPEAHRHDLVVLRLCSVTPHAVNGRDQHAAQPRLNLDKDLSAALEQCDEHDFQPLPLQRDTTHHDITGQVTGFDMFLVTAATE